MSDKMVMAIELILADWEGRRARAMTLSDKKTRIEVQVKPLSDALGRILWNITLKRRRAVQTHQQPKGEWEGLVLLDLQRQEL